LIVDVVVGNLRSLDLADGFMEMRVERLTDHVKLLKAGLLEGVLQLFVNHLDTGHDRSGVCGSLKAGHGLVEGIECG
jgi:hypothetical protein